MLSKAYRRRGYKTCLTLFIAEKKRASDNGSNFQETRELVGKIAFFRHDRLIASSNQVGLGFIDLSTSIPSKSEFFLDKSVHSK